MSATDVVPAETHTVGALLICDHDQPVMFSATLESTGPRAVSAAVQHGLDIGWLLAKPGPISEGVLDILAENGDIVADFDIPNPWAFEWCRTTFELRPTSTDCPVCEPAAYATTYGGAS